MVRPLKNILSIDRNGNAEYPGRTLAGDHTLKDDEECYKEHSLEQTEECYIERLLNTEKKKIIIYIHGGLNHPSQATDKAKDLIDLIKVTDGEYKPIFIHWRSALYSTYTEHLFHDRQGEYWNSGGYLTFPFVLVEDLGRALSRIPMVWLKIANNYYKTIFFGKTSGEENAVKLNEEILVNGSQNTNLSNFGELPILSDERGLSEKISDGVLNYAHMGLSLITAPLFDVIGTSAWATMKRRTEIMFTKTRPLGDAYDAANHSKQRVGIATKLFDRLQKKQRDEDTKLILVGHSMGAIIANKIISNWSEIKFEKIIYMGAASSIADYRLTILPYMRKTKESVFYNYSLHPIAENTDTYFNGFGGTGSLLTQIDNFYEDPTTENERTLGRWSNVIVNSPVK